MDTPPTVDGVASPVSQSATADAIPGLRWRIDGEFEKVFLYDREPIGAVAFDVRNPRAKKPWMAHVSIGHTEQGRFSTHEEAIRFVETALPAFLKHHEYYLQHPPSPAHSSPPLKP